MRKVSSTKNILWGLPAVVCLAVCGAAFGEEREVPEIIRGKTYDKGPQKMFYKGKTNKTKTDKAETGKAETSKVEKEKSPAAVKKKATEKENSEKSAAKKSGQLKKSDKKESDKKSDKKKKATEKATEGAATGPVNKKVVLVEPSPEFARATAQRKAREKQRLRERIAFLITRLGGPSWREARAELRRYGKKSLPALIEAMGASKDGYALQAPGAPTRQRPLGAVAYATLNELVREHSNFKGAVPALNRDAWRKWWKENGAALRMTSLPRK